MYLCNQIEKNALLCRILNFERPHNVLAECAITPLCMVAVMETSAQLSKAEDT